MKRIAPPALLALAAILVMPTRTTPTAPPSALSRVPVAVDGVRLTLKGSALLESAFDVDIGQLGGPAEGSPSIAQAPVIAHADRDEPRESMEIKAHGEDEAASALNDAVPRRTMLSGSGDGTTPGVAAHIAEASATPMREQSIASLTPTIRVAPEEKSEPLQIYAGLIEPKHEAREQRCLAEAVYFEARSEVEEGRAAVAQVVLNRVKSGVYPDSVCKVVYQNRHRKLACQFSFACEGKSLRITEPEAWKAAVRIARDVYEGRIYLEEIGASTHYHADYVQPDWAKKLKKMDVIGRHIFYAKAPRGDAA